MTTDPNGSTPVGDGRGDADDFAGMARFESLDDEDLDDEDLDGETDDGGEPWYAKYLFDGVADLGELVARMRAEADALEKRAAGGWTLSGEVDGGHAYLLPPDTQPGAESATNS